MYNRNRFLLSIPTLLILASYSTQAFAVCEKEQEEYQDWCERADKLSATSTTLGAIGGAFSFMTFGASLAPSIAAGVSASNACRIREEKLNNLNRCREQHAKQERERIEAENARIRMRAENAKREAERARERVERDRRLRIERERERAEMLAFRIRKTQEWYLRMKKDLNELFDRRIVKELASLLETMSKDKLVTVEDQKRMLEAYRQTIEEERTRELKSLKDEYDRTIAELK